MTEGSGGSLSRWCHIEEPEQSKTCQLLSLNQYVAFCGLELIPCVGAVGEAAAQAPALQTAACAGQLHPQQSSSGAEGLLSHLALAQSSPEMCEAADMNLWPLEA